jgi:hypothetical protein
MLHSGISLFLHSAGVLQWELPIVTDASRHAPEKQLNSAGTLEGMSHFDDGTAVLRIDKG